MVAVAHPDSTTDRSASPESPPSRPLPAVALRAPVAEDRDAFIAAMKSSAELHRPWVTPPVSAPEFDAWLTRSARPDFDANLATRVTDGAIVGYFNISQIIRGPLQSAFLGYGGGAAWGGAGYMPPALDHVIQRALTAPATHRSHPPARQRRLDPAGRALRIRPRGLLREIPEDRRPVARPRPLRDPLRAMGRAMAELTRCAWGEGSELMQAYHDEAWGVPERDARAPC